MSYLSKTMKTAGQFFLFCCDQTHFFLQSFLNTLRCLLLKYSKTYRQDYLLSNCSITSLYGTGLYGSTPSNCWYKDTTFQRNWILLLIKKTFTFSVNFANKLPCFFNPLHCIIGWYEIKIWFLFASCLAWRIFHIKFSNGSNQMERLATKLHKSWCTIL